MAYVASNRHQPNEKLINVSRGEGGGVGKGKKDTGYLYKAFMVARRRYRILEPYLRLMRIG